MSGWPRGAVDSLRCSADVLTGSRPFAHSLAPPLCALQRGQGRGAGETNEVGEGGTGRERETGRRCGKMDCGKELKGGREGRHNKERGRRGTDLT